MIVQRRIAAVLEVLGIYLASQFVTAFLIGVLKLNPANPLDKLTPGITNAELIIATRQFLVLLMLQYAGYFLNWWHRQRGPSAYGLTRAGRSWTALLLAGGATAALAAWPGITVLLVDALYDLGDTVPWRQALFDTSWRRWEFWLFMAVLSFAVIPLLEELFYRGYCQRRLAEDWGDGPAIVGTSLLFVFTHSQYLMLNAYNISLIAALIILSIGQGVVFAWTRSLIPSVVAHAIVNIPMTPLWQGIVLTVFVIAAMTLARRGVTVTKCVFSSASLVICVVLGVIGIAWAVIAHRMGWLQYAAGAMVVVAVILETLERRRERVSVSSIPPGKSL